MDYSTKKPIEVSVIIPIRDENDLYIQECVESLERLEFASPFEIIVVKGGNCAQARNFGIKLADGEIIGFIDSDCIAPKNWLAHMVAFLKKLPGVGGVGGIGIGTPQSSRFEKAVDFIFSTVLGSLHSPSLYSNLDRLVLKEVSALSSHNSVYWRRILMDVGGFDERFAFNEDTNLSYKTRKRGYKLMLVPEAFVWHHRRNNIKAFAKQFFLYGSGRMRSFLTDKRCGRIDVFGLLGLWVVLFLLAPLYPILLFSALSTYMILIVVYGAIATIKTGKWHYLLNVPIAYAVEHISFFFGMFIGIFKGKWNGKDMANCSIHLRRIIAHVPKRKQVNNANLSIPDKDVST